MKQLLVAALVLTGFAVVAGSASSNTLCAGIVPQNDMHIPVNSFSAGGLSEAEFNSVMDKMDAYYIPLLKAKGKQYDLKRLWTDDTVNASATEQGTDFIVNMYGGLARYPIMTTDGMTLVACHETGHHLGGAPKEGGSDGGGGGGNPFPFPFPFPVSGHVTDGGNPFPFPFPFPGGGGGGGMTWATDEGGADYYANLRCFHFILGGEDNIAWVKANTVDPQAKSTCSATYTDAKDAALCMRAATAGQVLAKIFQGLSKETTEPKFETPDSSIVTTTFDDHPHTQCRMDTYYQAALCMNDLKTELSDTDYKVGTCIDYNKVGARPRCWFHPSTSVQDVPLAEAY
jgi:hypothetical protein